MIKREKTGVCVLAAVISMLALFLVPLSASPYDLENKVESHVLDNGLKVLIVEHHISPTVSLYIRHLAGAVDEISGKSGTAHLLEHMLFKGTKSIGTKDYDAEAKLLEKICQVGGALDCEKKKGIKGDVFLIRSLGDRLKILQREESALTIKSEIDRLYSESGGYRFNASTGQDLTTYHISLPANKLELWARIESDRMMNPVFREFYSERNVVLEERRQTIDSIPERILAENFLATAFIAHPYRHPVIGWESDMEFLDSNYTREFFERYYSPQKTVIAVVGDVAASSALSLVKQYFGRIPSNRNVPDIFPDCILNFITDEPAQMGERRTNLAFRGQPPAHDRISQTMLPVERRRRLRCYRCHSFQRTFFRLYRSLVIEKGLAEKINSYNGFPGNRYPNLFVISAAPKRPHTNADIEKVIYDELEKLKTVPVTALELEKVRNQFKTDYLR